MDREILKKETPYLVILLGIFIIDLIFGLIKIPYEDELKLLLISTITLFTYTSIMFYNVIKYQKTEYDASPKVKEITKNSIISTTVLSALIFIIGYITSTSDMKEIGLIYFPIFIIVGALIGLLVGLVFSLNATLKTNLKIVFITIILFFILPTLDLIFINQGIEELSWISLFGFFLGTFIAILSKKGDYPKLGPVIGLLFASVPMVIDFFGVTQAIRKAIGYNLWILYILPIIGLLIGYWIEKSIFKNQTN